LRIADHDETTRETAETDYALLAVIAASVLDFERETGEDLRRVFEVEAALIQRLFALGRIITDEHLL
jgi:hypothetical protein